MPCTKVTKSGDSSRSYQSLQSGGSSVSIMSPTVLSSSQSSAYSLTDASQVETKVHRVVYLTEQVRHHPPVSAFYGECRDVGVSICGNDHLSAHFTGTCISSCSNRLIIAIKVYPGTYSKGIFINLKHHGDEEYQLTHPCANITGFISLKIHPYVTVQDYCVITCPKTKLKALLKYREEVVCNM